MTAIVSAVVCLAVFAFASSFDTVFERLERVRVLRLVEEHGGYGTASLLWLFEHRAHARDALLTLRTTALIGLAGASVWIIDVFGQPGRFVLVLVAAATVVAVVAVVARLVALTYRESLGRLLAPPIALLVRVVRPVTFVLVAVARGIVKGARDLSSPYASDEELNRLLLDDEPTSEEIEPEERAMIRSIFELGDRRVREIMVPRPDMVAVPSDAHVTDVLNSIIDAGYSRLPVYDAADPDRIVGVVYAKDLLAKIASEPVFHGWHALLRPPAFVPETKRVDDLLRELQTGAVHLVFVVDEYGELVGLVTIEDILEEIVGEIVDEYDEEITLSEALGNDVWRVDGRMTVSEFNSQFASDLPVDDSYDTVGGMVFAMLGELPSGGEQIELEAMTITVEQVQGRRIGTVLVTQHDDAADRGDASEAAT